MSKRKMGARMSVLSDILSNRTAHMHFAGICGVSMSALAEYYQRKGYHVTGSDAERGLVGDRLSRLGIRLSNTNSAECMQGTDVLITTSAISDASPEIIYAKENGIPIYSRAELLGRLMLDYPERIGVSGTHGKSTTTAMISHILTRAGLSYTTLVGAPVYGGTGLFMGGNDGIVYEACEYRDAYLEFSPTTAIVTGVELDHTDYFKSMDSLVKSFSEAISEAECVIINADYKTTNAIIRESSAEIISYGVDKNAKYRYNIISSDIDGTRAIIYRDGDILGELYLQLMGDYNVANATAAIATAVYHGVEPNTALSALSDFRGIPRRLERIGSLGEAPVYYDYAHHPTEISSAIIALRNAYNRVRVVFRPHTYTRTRDLWEDFAKVLSLPDEVIITDIYPARERCIDGITAEALAHDIGDRARYVPLRELYQELCKSSDNIPLVIMGAGDMTELVERVRNNQN